MLIHNRLIVSCSEMIDSGRWSDKRLQTQRTKTESNRAGWSGLQWSKVEWSGVGGVESSEVGLFRVGEVATCTLHRGEGKEVYIYMREESE